MDIKPVYTCTASYEVMFVTRNVLREAMPHLSLREISTVVHALHSIVPDLDATDADALTDALNLVAERF